MKLPGMLCLILFAVAALLPGQLSGQATTDTPRPLNGLVQDRYFIAGASFGQQTGNVRFTNFMVLHNQLSYGLNPHVQVLGSFSWFSGLPRFFRDEPYENPVSLGAQLSVPGLPEWLHLSLTPQLIYLTGGSSSLDGFSDRSTFNLTGKLTLGNVRHHVTLGYSSFWQSTDRDIQDMRSHILLAASTQLARNVHLISESRFFPAYTYESIHLLGFRYLIRGPFSFTHGLAWEDFRTDIVPFLGLHVKF